MYILKRKLTKDLRSMSGKKLIVRLEVQAVQAQKEKVIFFNRKGKKGKQNYKMVKQKNSTEYLRYILIEMEYSTTCSQQKTTV